MYVTTRSQTVLTKFNQSVTEGFKFTFFRLQRSYPCNPNKILKTFTILFDSVFLPLFYKSLKVK